MADRAQQIISDQERLASQRGNFEEQWQEVSERVLPRSSDLFFSGAQPMDTQGQKKTDKMLDSGAAIALERYASILASLITPENQKWQRLTTTEPTINRRSDVRLWFDAARDKLFQQRRSPRSGFYAQMMECYTSIGAFGNGLIYTDFTQGTPTDPTGGLRYRFTHLSEAYMRHNHQGVIDFVTRKFKLAHRQVMQMFELGQLDRLPDGLEKLASQDKTRDDEYEYLHCVKPNDEYDPGRADARGMPWAEYYVCVKTQQIIKRGGYWVFPYSIGRPSVTPGETYGRGAAMMVLPNIKVLNEQKRTQLRMGHRIVDPVLLAHDDGVIDTFSLRPGAVNAGGVNAQGQRLVQRLDDNVGQLPQLEKLMEMERSVINDAFLVSLFQILMETPRMTATEVLQRLAEKSILLGPSMARLRDDLPGTMTIRELDLLARNGRLPPMPPALIEADGEFEIQYENPLARAARADEAAGFARVAEQALQFAQITGDPGPLDHFNFDVAMPELAEINAVPARWISTQDQVEQKRNDRNQQAAIQNAIDAAPGVAGLVKAGAGGPR